MAQLRKYEVNKMRYFYAVIHCNSKETAERIYNEYNDFEFELSSIRLNLSFIADDLVFSQEVKETATQVPVGYEFKASNSLNRALSHTKVKLTWDETDPKRARKFQRIMEQDPDQLSDDDYREFLASEDEDAPEEDQVEDYRRKLLGGLAQQGDSFTRKRDLQAGEDLDVKFNVGFGEDLGKRFIDEKRAQRDSQRETAWEAYQSKRKQKIKDKKLKAKELKKEQKKATNPDEDNGAEMELLVSSKSKEDFKANTKDTRFQQILKDKDFAIDPTNKHFGRVAEGEFVKAQKVKRQRMHN